MSVEQMAIGFKIWPEFCPGVQTHERRIVLALQTENCPGCDK